MKRNFCLITIAATIALLSGGLASAQDFNKSYALGAGAHIQIQNISGDLKVVGYAGNAVVVEATRFGRDRELVQVEDLSAGNKVEVRVRYPENGGNCEAGVNFEVRVPANTNFIFDRLSSVSGNIVVGGLRGDVHASSVSGDVFVKDALGLVNASSVSGNVDVEIYRIEGSGEMKFSSVSGSVHVKAPTGGVSDVEMSSLSGLLETDFPIQVQEKRYGPGRSARGTVGNGSCSLKITTVSGKVSLVKM